MKTNLVALLALLASVHAGCKPAQLSGSRLAVDGSGEQAFVADACDQKMSISRYSRIRIDGREVLIMTKDFCASQKSARRVSLGLVEQKPARRPVLIIDGYGGNAASDQMVHQSVQDTQPWGTENFRVLNIPAGASITEAQRIVMNDRRQNPQDYGSNSWVGLIEAAHGYVGADGRHRTVKTDVTNQKIDSNQVGPTQVESSYLTTDRAGALIEGIGHNAGTISCSFYQCQSGQVRNDPDFDRLQQSGINPAQKRVFQFSSAPDRTARVSPYIQQDGRIGSATPIEQSVGFLMQQAESDGLTVDEYQSKLKRANLGNAALHVDTAFVPNSGDSTAPGGDLLGIPSHSIVTPLFAPQAPSVVGPKDAFILPPGIKPDSFNPPIATSGDQLRSVTNETAPGDLIRNPLDVGAGPFEAEVPSATTSSQDLPKNHLPAQAE
jgi:hypothetical protein